MSLPVGSSECIVQLPLILSIKHAKFTHQVDSNRQVNYIYIVSLLEQFFTVNLFPDRNDSKTEFF